MVLQGSSNCFANTGLLRYEIPDCQKYAAGDILGITGTVTTTSDSTIVPEKMLNIRSITLIEPSRFSSHYWRRNVVMSNSKVRSMLLSVPRQLLSFPEVVLLESFIFGSGVELPEQMSHSVQVMGIAHVIAVSGSHLTLVSSLLIPMSAWMKKNDRAILLLIMLAWYASLTGWQPPVVRAWLMLVLLITGKAVFGRPVRLLEALAGSVMLTLLLDPWLILSLSWQLSVGATFGIVSIYPIILKSSVARLLLRPGNWLPGRVGSVWKASCEAVFASTASLFCIAPLLINSFETWSWGSLASSFLLWWLFPMVISSCFIGVILLSLLAISSVHQAFLQLFSVVLLEIPLKLVILTLAASSQWEWTMIAARPLPPSSVALWYAVVALVKFTNGNWFRRQRRHLFLRYRRNFGPGDPALMGYRSYQSLHWFKP